MNSSFLNENRFFHNKNPNINYIDQRHYDHQYNLKEFINDFKDNSQGKLLRNSPLFQRKRTFSDISTIKLNENRPIFSETKPNFCHFFSETKPIISDFRGFCDISPFNCEKNEKKARNYDTIIVPTHLEANILSFNQRRSNYKRKGENPDQIDNKVYLKKYNKSFNLQYDENSGKNRVNPYRNPYLGDISNGFIGKIDEKTRNLENFKGKIGENQMNLPPFKEPFNIFTQEFREKDCQNINKMKKNVKKKLNLANLPLIIQDFVVLMEYDKEIERAKSVLKENGRLKLGILYKIMGKPANSIIEIQDFARLLQFLRLELAEANLLDLFKRFSKNDSLKLK